MSKDIELSPNCGGARIIEMSHPPDYYHPFYHYGSPEDMIQGLKEGVKALFSITIPGDIEVEFVASYIQAVGHFRIDTRANNKLIKRENYPSEDDFKKAITEIYRFNEIPCVLF